MVSRSGHADCTIQLAQSCHVPDRKPTISHSVPQRQTGKRVVAYAGKRGTGAMACCRSQQSCWSHSSCSDKRYSDASQTCGQSRGT